MDFFPLKIADTNKQMFFFLKFVRFYSFFPFPEKVDGRF